MKHKEIIKAWLDGATVECKMSGSATWFTLRDVNECRQMNLFSDDNDYRIKPKTYKYRIAMLCVNLNGVDFLRDLKIIYEYDFAKIELDTKFIKWVGDVLEFEP